MIFFQNFNQMLVLILINIDGVEKIEMIPSVPGNLNNRALSRGEGCGGGYLVVLHNIRQMTDQSENISRLGQPVVVTREEGVFALKHNTDWSAPSRRSIKLQRHEDTAHVQKKSLKAAQTSELPTWSDQYATDKMSTAGTQTLSELP